MHRCKKCGRLMEKSVRPEHTEDLGGVVVKVLNAVQVLRCPECKSEMVAIPDMDGLGRATAISRALNPVRLSGREVKFFRRVLDMTQVEFAKAMDLTPESVSRWETDARGVGGACEKLVRHNTCALLRKNARGRPYDPAVIAHMQIIVLPDGEVLPPIEMVRVRMQIDSPNSDGWGETARVA
jgi:DNA-binding transcriptional regulator YiaG